MGLCAAFIVTVWQLVAWEKLFWSLEKWKLKNAFGFLRLSGMNKKMFGAKFQEKKKFSEMRN